MFIITVLLWSIYNLLANHNKKNFPAATMFNALFHLNKILPNFLFVSPKREMGNSFKCILYVSALTPSNVSIMNFLSSVNLFHFAGMSFIYHIYQSYV